ncbi:hypothetical protein G6514_002888 [Epicoccum nigrum]|nr:hypothetical protein G6514_002888 [Epicoccum nigrum]
MDTLPLAQGIVISTELTHQDRGALNEILRRKLKGMPADNEIRSRTLSLDQMERAEHVRWPYSNNPTTVINFGATFAGVLHFRGFVIESIRSHKPLEEWPVQAILSMFVSGIHPHRSFCKYFKETRVRILHCLCERIARRGTGVQAGYLLACLEFAQVGDFFDHNNPTKHMLVFIKLLQNRPGHFLIQDHARNKAMRRELPQILATARNSAAWRKDDNLLSSVCDFLIGGRQAAQTAAGDRTKKPKKKSRGRNKGKGKVKSEDEDAARRMEEAFGTPKFIVGNIRLSDTIRNNPLLAALAESMPGVHLVDEDAGPVADFGDEVANLTRALDALEMIRARGDVVLEEGDEVTFEQATQQQGPQGRATSGAEEDVEMVM